MSVAEPIASGRLETKIARIRPTLTPEPPASPRPSTGCSGIPSRNAPSASAVPPPESLTVPDALDQAGEHKVRERPGREPDPDCRRPADVHALLEELEADRTDERAGPEGEHEPDQPRRPRPRQAKQHPEHERRGGNHTPAQGGAHQLAPIGVEPCVQAV